MSASASDRLPARTRLAYGAGELGPAMAGSTMVFFQLVFLTNVAGLRADLAGAVLLIGKIWDAVNDPLIGWLSDHTRTRWGRRLPWILASAVPFAAFFWLQWIVPGFAAGHQLGLFAYYVVVSLVFNTFYTGLMLPHNALTPEFSRDYDERSRLTASRMAFSLGGSVGGLVLAVIVFKALAAAAPAAQYAALGAAIAGVSLIAIAVCVAGIWRFALARDASLQPDSPPPAPAVGWREQWRIVSSNRPYLIVCGIYLFSWLAMQFTASILPFYVASWMRLPALQFQLLALTVQATALALIPAWAWLSVRVGKKPVYFYGMAFWLVAQAGLYFVQPGQIALMYGLGFLAGFGIAVCYLIPNAMLPDTLEYDELRTGQRREGIFYGFFVFLQKTSLALGTFVVGQALAAAGYISSTGGTVDQPESALQAIRFAIGPLPAVALLIGIALTALYPITRERHAEILAELRRRRGE